MLITLGWFTEHGQPFDAQAAGFHARLRHFVDSRVPESWRREVVEGQGWGIFGAAASPGCWNWNLVSRDQDVLVATVGLPVGLDDTVLSGGPIGVGRGVLAGRSVLDGVVPPLGVLVTDGTRFAAQQDWFGMASIYVYRSHGVVAFSNRPILLPTSLVTQSTPTPRASPARPACDAFVGSSSPVMGSGRSGRGETFVCERNPNNTWKISVRKGTCLDDAAVAGPPFRGGMSLAGITLLHKLVAEHLDPAAEPEQVQLGIETDRGPWVQALLAAGYVVYATNPLQVARYRERHSPSGATLDAGDAHLLAEIVRLERAHHRPVAGQ